MSIYDYDIQKSNGETLSLSSYKNQVLLIVNTATKCGFANQFKDLEHLHQTYYQDGLRVLGFPCNQFMNQEPVSNNNMAETCEINFGVTFPLFKKIDVKGPYADPLFQFLTKEQSGFMGKNIKWNFTKFLVNRQGTVVSRIAPKNSPLTMEKHIQQLL